MVAPAAVTGAMRHHLEDIMPLLAPIELYTPRLKLRWMDPQDVDAHFAVFSDPAVMQYWSGEPWTDPDQAAKAIERIEAACIAGSDLCLGIELRDTGQLIGNVSLHHFVDASRRCEIGYALASRYWGKAYAQEAVRAAIAYGFSALGLNRIEADIDPANAASIRVLEKLGFRREGFMPERWIVHGTPADTVFYGLLKAYWDNTQT